MVIYSYTICLDGVFWDGVFKLTCCVFLPLKYLFLVSHCFKCELRLYLIFTGRCHMLGDDLFHFTFWTLSGKYCYYFHFGEQDMHAE